MNESPWSGFSVGLGLILLNPSAIVTWVVEVGSRLGSATPAEGIGAALGVFIGSFCWFATIGYLTFRGRNFLAHKAVWILRVVGVLLLLYGVYNLYGAADYWLL